MSNGQWFYIAMPFKTHLLVLAPRGTKSGNFSILRLSILHPRSFLSSGSILKPGFQFNSITGESLWPLSTHNSPFTRSSTEHCR